MSKTSTDKIPEFALRDLERAGKTHRVQG